MTAKVVVNDSKTGNAARVTKYGQLVVAPLAYSIPVSKNLTLIDTAFNFLAPKSGFNIVITDIIVSADKNVSVTDPGEVEIYEAAAFDSLAITEGIISPRLLRGDSLVLTGLNLLVPEGLWVNAKTNDANMLITIMYYRVPLES